MKNPPLFAAATLKFKLPSISIWKPIAKAGGLLTYGPVLWEPYFPRAITIADKILSGTHLLAKFRLSGRTAMNSSINLEDRGANSGSGCRRPSRRRQTRRSNDVGGLPVVLSVGCCGAAPCPQLGVDQK